jgi:hypothetical protein
MVKFDIMNIRKVFLVEGFRYKISVYSMYEPLIKFCLLKNLYALLYFTGLKLTNNSTINRILFAVTIFQHSPLTKRVFYNIIEREREGNNINNIENIEWHIYKSS